MRPNDHQELFVVVHWLRLLGGVNSQKEFTKLYPIIFSMILVIFFAWRPLNSQHIIISDN